MKTCSQCGASYVNCRILCLRCNEILEEPTYLKLVFVTTVASFGVHFLLHKLGYKGGGLISETLKTEILLLILCVTVWKLVQKYRDPRRKTLYELASLYSDRTGRAIIIGAVFLITSVFLFSTAPPPNTTAIHSELWVSFVRFRSLVVLPAVLIYIGLVLWVQGRDFLNFRLKNSLEQREQQLVRDKFQQRQDLN